MWHRPTSTSPAHFQIANPLEPALLDIWAKSTRLVEVAIASNTFSISYALILYNFPTLSVHRELCLFSTGGLGAQHHQTCTLEWTDKSMSSANDTRPRHSRQLKSYRTSLLAGRGVISFPHRFGWNWLRLELQSRGRQVSDLKSRRAFGHHSDKR